MRGRGGPLCFGPILLKDAQRQLVTAGRTQVPKYLYKLVYDAATDKKRGCFYFEFDRHIEGQRVRARKYLPKTWSAAQADAFDRQESAKLYARASAVERAAYSISEAVAVYIKERLPHLKSGANIERELAQMFFAYHGRPITALAEACRFYTARAGRADENNDAPPRAGDLAQLHPVSDISVPLRLEASQHV